ncbi:type II secretion system minor pseudopilin GspK [Desulfosediminicola ganghwensis]|uniref:type II secretion system minor pseudopilin GspK n=1 Tax=Desulfosediminicola ganghwensis TaxID=2569540 RepID=UPI0010ABA368|nr:type II secretion system minor pseudopilin GspK [Desulfosediminicola ganghwensis]
MRQTLFRLNDRGMALLITIMVISLLIGVTVQFNKTVRQDYFASRTQLDGEYLKGVARSGLSIGMALLEADGLENNFDSELDSWASLDDETLSTLFSGGTLALNITDHSGRLQINSLVARPEGGGEESSEETREILKRLLLSGTFSNIEEQQVVELIDALVDWLDTDERESDFGAEDSYYQSLSPPYEAANGPISSIEELLLVKGVDRELLFGNDISPGLADFITVYGDDGKININTAPRQLLQALHPQMSEELALTLEDYRSQELNRDNLENADWYRQVPAWPGDIELPDGLLSTKSVWFELESQGVFHDQRKRMSAVVVRDQDSKTVLVSKKSQ